MIIRINGKEIAAYPSSFLVTTLDLDDAETTVRTADGTLNRDRIAVKQKIEMDFGPLEWDEISSILQAVQDEFFEVYYPDPVLGTYTTKIFYVGDRPAAVAISKGDGRIVWTGLKLSLIER
ncbi:MAG TPA: hypothetical protein GX514_09140 [Thermoanaerobacterales bacterium]|nr:hypothetical protein [Thermoanaerobacterales bacterium]